MDNTPWELIIAMFAYAILGWVALFAIHACIRRKREPETAREAARGYQQSWNNSRSADF
jgi:hypothetical protein